MCPIGRLRILIGAKSFEISYFVDFSFYLKNFLCILKQAIL